jgi:dihydroxyacetone kinase-like protein
MGPLYGSIFLGISSVDASGGVTPDVFLMMLRAAKEGVEEISPARPGDKTLMDALVPAVEAYEKALGESKDFAACLTKMKKAAVSGRDSTKDMVAKLGRASRLGERSRGVLDAGAASCCVLISALADEMILILSE